MTQSIKNFVHPSVARASKEAALECAKIAAEVSMIGGSAGRVRELIVEQFGLEFTPSRRTELPTTAETQSR